MTHAHKTPYSERFDQALVYASQLHRNHFRKGSGLPYVNHLLAVASLVGESGGTEDQVIGALLHDAIEDCSHKVPDIREEIEARFGPEVLAIVEACTDGWGEVKPPWRERKEAYLSALRNKNSGHPALLVSLADKVHNARTILADYRAIGDELWERFRGKREGTLWYYSELAEIFGEHLPEHTLSDELKRIVEEVNHLADR